MTADPMRHLLEQHVQREGKGYLRRAQKRCEEKSQQRCRATHAKRNFCLCVACVQLRKFQVLVSELLEVQPPLDAKSKAAGGER